MTAAPLPGPAAAPTPIRSGRAAGAVDHPAAERAVADLLRALGKDTDSPHLADTPRRVAAAYQELLTPRSSTPPPSPTSPATRSWCSPVTSR